MDIIQTDRLVFREFTQADIDNLFLLLSDPIGMKYAKNGTKVYYLTEAYVIIIILVQNINTA